jgi:hypothetical protein
MERTAIIIMSDIENVADKARLSLAMLATREFHEAEEEVKIIFEGAATKWISLLKNPEHKIHSFYAKIKGKIEVCGYCANAYGVKELVEAEGLKIVTEYKGHPSIRKLVKNNFNIITY